MLLEVCFYIKELTIRFVCDQNTFLSYIKTPASVSKHKGPLFCAPVLTNYNSCFEIQIPGFVITLYYYKKYLCATVTLT